MAWTWATFVAVVKLPKNSNGRAAAFLRGMLVLALILPASWTAAQNDPPESTPVIVPGSVFLPGETNQPAPAPQPSVQVGIPPKSRLGSKGYDKSLEEYRRQEFIRHSREASEKQRKHLVLPPSAVGVIEDDNPALQPGQGAQTAVVVHSAAYDNLMHTLFMTALMMAGAVLIARKLVPEFGEYVNNWVQPWKFMPAVAGDTSVQLLAEEKSVAEFHANFCAVARVAEPNATGEFANRSTLESTLYTRALDHVLEIQRLLPEVNLSADEKKQRLVLREILDKLRPLKSLAEATDLRPVWQIVCAVELLLKRLAEKEGSINSSVLRTFGQAVSVLAELCRPGLNPNLLVEPPLRILVVDDEAFSRFALCQSLERTLHKPEIADSATKALKLAAEQTYDLMFLDVIMPDMDGFELCPKIHETERNASTPVVFVTSLNDTKSRAKSVLSGGRDFITKPFLTFEVTVKALTLVTRERMRGRGGVGKETVAPAPVAVG